MEGIDLSNAPQIHEGWIYSMVILGFIGSFISFSIILIGAYKTYHITKYQYLSKPLLTLNFMIWGCNFLACIVWCCLRTNLFHHLTEQKCVGIYIFNYLCYMIAKYCIHTLLFYRLYLAFKGTCCEIDYKFIKTLIGIISINFIIFTSLWLETSINHATVGVSKESETLQICTLFNGDSNSNLSIFDQIWPTLYGGQDFLVGLITLIAFIKKINELSTNPQDHNVETESLIRKLSILGSMAIGSTFIFYTFAVPFYPNLTFLLPFDATINSLCIILLLDYTKKWYNKLCCCIDRPLMKKLHHLDVNQLSLADVMTHSNLDIHIRNNYDKNKIQKVEEGNHNINNTKNRRFNRDLRDFRNRSLNDIEMSIKPLPLTKSKHNNKKYSRSGFL